MTREDLERRLQKIRLFAFDVDGVLTDGRITFTSSGEELKSFSARDGMGFRCLHESGLRSAIITARGSEAVQRRARELGIGDVVLMSSDKRQAFLELCRRHELSTAEAAFMGDDLQDLGALTEAGVSFSVADCPEELRERVDIVTRTPAGSGAAREAIERVLKAQGRWESAVERFLQ